MNTTKIPSNKIELKKMPKKKKPKHDFHLSVFFRMLVSFSVTVILFFSSVFVYNTLLANNGAAASAFNKGNEFFDQGLYASALEHYTEAVSLAADNVDYRLKLAVCYEMCNDENNVLKTVDEGIYLAPNEYRYPAFLIGFYVRAGKMTSAYDVIDSITSLSVKSRLDDISPAAVRILPSANTTEKVTSVTISTDSECDIYYTLDGTVPTVSSAKYSDPIDVSAYESSLVVKAVAVNSEGLISRVATVNYNFADPSKKYTFKDAVLGKIVAANLGKSVKSITFSDIMLLEEIDSSLYTGDGSVTSLADLPNFKNLKTLYLKDQQSITEYCDFSQLPSLESLSLVNCSVSNAIFKSICSITTLTYVDMSSNFISSVTPISQLVNLKTAIFDQNQLKSLTAFSSNSKLETLSVSFNGISSLSPLKSLKNLKSFTAAYNNISSIVDLEKCTSLVTLELSGNQIQSINALAKLGKLQNLELANNGITSISALSGKTSLKSVDISGNPVSSFTALSSSALTTLTARNCGITSLADFASLNVVTLDISNSPASADIFNEQNAFTDVSPLASCENLKYLKINGVTSVTSIAALSGNEHISSIYCSGCSSLDLGDFNNTTGIKIIK